MNLKILVIPISITNRIQSVCIYDNRYGLIDRLNKEIIQDSIKLSEVEYSLRGNIISSNIRGITHKQFIDCLRTSNNKIENVCKLIESSNETIKIRKKRVQKDLIRSGCLSIVDYFFNYGFKRIYVNSHLLRFTSINNEFLRSYLGFNSLYNDHNHIYGDFHKAAVKYIPERIWVEFLESDEDINFNLCELQCNNNYFFKIKDKRGEFEDITSNNVMMMNVKSIDFTKGIITSLIEYINNILKKIKIYRF